MAGILPNFSGTTDKPLFHPTTKKPMWGKVCGCPWPYCDVDDGSDTVPAGCTPMPSPLLLTIPAIDFDPLVSDAATFLTGSNEWESYWTAYNIPERVLSMTSRTTITPSGSVYPWAGREDASPYQTRNFVINNAGGLIQSPSVAPAADIYNDSGWLNETSLFQAYIKFWDSSYTDALKCTWELWVRFLDAEMFNFKESWPNQAYGKLRPYDDPVSGTPYGSWTMTYSPGGYDHFDATADTIAAAAAAYPHTGTAVVS